MTRIIRSGFPRAGLNQPALQCFTFKHPKPSASSAVRTSGGFLFVFNNQNIDVGCGHGASPMSFPCHSHIRQSFSGSLERKRAPPFGPFSAQKPSVVHLNMARQWLIPTTPECPILYSRVRISQRFFARFPPQCRGRYPRLRSPASSSGVDLIPMLRRSPAYLGRSPSRLTQHPLDQAGIAVHQTISAVKSILILSFASTGSSIRNALPVISSTDCHSLRRLNPPD